MLIGILGPLTIDGDGGPVVLGGTKRRLLLTLLAAASPHPVGVERIVGALWDDRPPAAATATLQTYVYQLRKLLGTDVVVTTPAGYALTNCDVDVRQFEALLRSTQAETTADRRHRLAAALASWRGAPFAEFPDVLALAAERTRLVELHLGALADRIDDDLALGEHALVIGELESLVAAHPLRERLWAQLMTALYRSDRQAEALRAYGRLRRHLRDEVGVSPGPALVTLERQILDHDPALATPPAAPATSASTTSRRAAVLEVDGGGGAPSRRLRFATVHDAVNAALREAAQDPDARMAVHVGLVDDDEGAVTGPAVARAARVSAAGRRGQILLTAAAQAEVAGVGSFAVADLGEHRLRPSGQPERVYQLLAPGTATAVLAPSESAAGDLDVFVGRTGEIQHVAGRVRRLRAGGPGGVVMLVGEAGIGKTATAERIARVARAEGATVLWGRALDGPWASPYGAVLDAIAAHLRDADDSTLRADTMAELQALLPNSGASAATLVADAGDSEARDAQVRTLVTISRFVAELSTTAPVVLVLDDLHWAEDGTLAALRHLGRETARLPVLVLGTFRDDEVGPDHPLRATLGALPRECDTERVRLHGLTADDVAAIADAVTGASLPPEEADRIARDTAGNPFFVHQVLRRPDVAVPGSVVDVVALRLGRLSSPTQQLLRASCVFDGDFSFPVATAVAGIDEHEALDALDGALDAHLLVAGARPDTYAFVHALARDAIAGELSPSRQIRLHRRAAEAMLAASATSGLTADVARAVAGHFHRSRSLPGAERGVAASLVAADHATTVGALDDAVQLARAALDLVAAQHPRFPELFGRLGLALARAARADEAWATIAAAIEAIAAAHGPDRAADYVVEAWRAGVAGLEGLEPGLIERGLQLAGDRRDVTWAYLYVLWAETVEPRELVDDGLFREASALIMTQTGNAGIGSILSYTHPTRDDLLTLGEWPSARMFGAGDLRTTAGQFHAAAAELKRAGRLLSWAKQQAYASIAETALGNLDRAEAILAQLSQAELPFTTSPEVRSRLLLAAYLLWSARDDGWEIVTRFTFDGYGEEPDDDNVTLHCSRAKFHARRGRRDAVAESVERAAPLLPVVPYVAAFEDRMVVHDFVEALWYGGLTDHLAVAGDHVDRRLARDLRGPMSDMRLCKARLTALSGDVAAAERWFAESRAALDESGARPLRAIADFDEGLMRRRLGDEGRGAQLVDAAAQQFEALGMTGWLRRIP